LNEEINLDKSARKPLEKLMEQPPVEEAQPGVFVIRREVSEKVRYLFTASQLREVIQE